MRIYLAARYSRRVELLGYAQFLRAMGHEVTSRWLNGDHQATDADMLGEQSPENHRQRFAQEDWEDLMAADCTISFTEEPRGTNSRGGRHVEYGAALAAGQFCIVVGPRENVFHCMPEILHVPTVDSFTKNIGSILENQVIFHGSGKAVAQ